MRRPTWVVTKGRFDGERRPVVEARPEHRAESRAGPRTSAGWRPAYRQDRAQASAQRAESVSVSAMFAACKEAAEGRGERDPPSVIEGPRAADYLDGLSGAMLAVRMGR